MTVSVPNHLPTLAKGAHKSSDGQACVMEYVSLLAGLPWSDNPPCTHPVMSSMARVVNDRLPDSHRHLLVPLIGRLFGTSESGTLLERQVLSVRLAVWCADQVVGLAPGGPRPVVEGALAAARVWADCPCDLHAVNAVNAAYAAYAAYAASAAYAVNAAYAAYAASAAYAAYAAYAASAAANANAAASAGTERLVALLTGLIDEYDRLTGRTEHRVLTDTELADLSAMVASSS